MFVRDQRNVHRQRPAQRYNVGANGISYATGLGWGYYEVGLRVPEGGVYEPQQGATYSRYAVADRPGIAAYMAFAGMAGGATNLFLQYNNGAGRAGWEDYMPADVIDVITKTLTTDSKLVAVFVSGVASVSRRAERFRLGGAIRA